MAATIRVEVGPADAEFTPTEVAEILAGLHAAQRKIDALGGVLSRAEPTPMQTLARLLREAAQDVPVPEGCTGYWDEFALLTHDGDTCPVHELDPDAEEDD